MSTKLEFFRNIDTNFTTLFVEDDSEVRMLTTKVLQDILPVIISAKDGKEGLQLYKEHYTSNNLRNIDLIITDIQMPNKNGLDMLSEIKKLNPSIPIVIISAHSDTEYFLKAIAIGIDNYILKPYTYTTILEVLYDTLLKRYDTNMSAMLNICDSLDNDLIDIGFEYFYDQFNRLLYHKDDPIKLSKNECLLLDVLIEANGNCVTYKIIEYRIWEDPPLCSHSLRSLIYRFRSKTHNNLVQAVPSLGYKLPKHNTN